jgi:hypothetical protein
MKMTIDKEIEKAFEEYMEIAGLPLSRIRFGITRKLPHAWGTTWKIGNFLAIQVSRFHLRLHPEEIEDTIAHEVAHCKTWIDRKYWGHGRPWKSVMKQFGLVPLAEKEFVIYR